MNKFCEISEQGSIGDDINFIKKFVHNNKTFEGETWKHLALKSKDEDKKHVNNDEERFSLHPDRFFSDTDASTDNSPKGNSTSSSSSNLHLKLNEAFLYQENKLKIKNARKKLQKKLTQSKDDNEFYIEGSIGDSQHVTPRINSSDNAMSNYEIVKNKKSKTGFRREINREISNKCSKRMLPSKSPSLQSSNRTFISDTVFEKKFKIFVEKSLHTITDIRSLLEKGLAPPDGDEDVSRRIIRVKEFSNRFSRNYLYPLVRQLDDLTKMNFENTNLNQKLLSAYQITLNGLQAYHNHLPTSIGSCSSDKLKLLLKHLLELCDIHNKTVKQPDENCYSDFINTFRLNAELTLQKIEDHFSAVSTDSVLKSNTTKLSLPQYASKNNKNKPKKNNVEARLSMYSVSASFRKDLHWKKAVENLAKRKHNVKSRYKTAMYRHRPPVEKDSQVVSLPSKCKLFSKKSSGILKRTPVTTPINDDNITTMVELENKKDDKEIDSAKETDGQTTETLNHEEIVVKLLQLVLDTNRKKNATEGEENARNDATTQGVDERIADILERLREGGDVEVLQKILDGLQSRTAEKQELELQVVNSQTSISDDGTAKKRKEPIVTVTGAKNAKLICIKDENSIIENHDESDLENKDCQTEKEIPPKAVTSSETQTDVQTKEKVSKSTQRSTKPSLIKMSRLPKSSKFVQMLPKDYAVNIIQYKLDFHKHCKTNPMYRKTTKVVPWMLMGKLSDEILNHALLVVAREIEVNDIVEQIYKSELQI